MKKITFLATIFLALPLSADLRQQIESKTGWVAYSVPIAGRHQVCSWGDSMNITDAPYFERSSALWVLYEVSGGRIQTVRLSSPECGSLSKSVQWLENVDPKESMRLLRKLIDEDNRSIAKKAVNALALHQGAVDIGQGSNTSFHPP